MENRTSLKGYFQTGDVPTQSQFASLIDSCPNSVDDNDGYQLLTIKRDIVVSGSTQNIEVLAADATSFFMLQYVVIQEISHEGDTSDTDSRWDMGGIAGRSYEYIQYNFITQESMAEYYDLSSALEIVADPLPVGTTAMTIRVIIQGFKVSKT